MRDCIKLDALDDERTRWLDGLDNDEICQLASSFRGGDQCAVFQPRKHGAFNVCYFVEFKSPLERWVVRIPIPVTIPKTILDEKTEIELATMRYVSAKTTIPLPKVHAYAYSDASPIGLPFIITDYVQGRSLLDLGFKSDLKGPWGSLIWGDSPNSLVKRLHEQLANIFVQLRQLEFPQLGALGFPSRDTPALACGPDDIRVCNRPLSIDIAFQEHDGLEPNDIVPPKRTMSTAREFVDVLLRLADNKLEKEPDQGMDQFEPASILYAAHHFKRFIQDDWLDQSANEGPFVLMHGDMDDVLGNLLFDDDHNLVGVVDWEWSRVVPAQLMVPPKWLIATGMDLVLIHQDSYNKQVQSLRAAVQEREKAHNLPPVLSQQWAVHETWCHTTVALALTHSSYQFEVYWNLIFPELVPKAPSTATREEREEHLKNNEMIPRIKAFFEASEERRGFLEKKIQQQLDFFRVEREHYGDEEPRRIVPRYC